MFEDIGDWLRKNIKCCACGGTLDASMVVNIVRVGKIATWKFPFFGRTDIPDYKPLAVAIICDECVRKKEEIRYCIELEKSPCQEGSPYRVKYHKVEGLEDSNKAEDQMKYYFGSKFRLRDLLSRAARLGSVN